MKSLFLVFRCYRYDMVAVWPRPTTQPSISMKRCMLVSIIWISLMSLLPGRKKNCIFLLRLLKIKATKGVSAVSRQCWVKCCSRRGTTAETFVMRPESIGEPRKKRKTFLPYRLFLPVYIALSNREIGCTCDYKGREFSVRGRIVHTVRSCIAFWARSKLSIASTIRLRRSSVRERFPSRSRNRFVRI